MRVVCCLLLALSGAVAFSVVQAEVISLQANAARDVSRPARGMTMREVESRYGTPLEKAPPVGKPPITRWDYEGFSVFFEYDHVLHAVAQHKLNATDK